jgi:hypothetical protein
MAKLIDMQRLLYFASFYILVYEVAFARKVDFLLDNLKEVKYSTLLSCVKIQPI